MPDDTMPTREEVAAVLAEHEGHRNLNGTDGYHCNVCIVVAGDENSETGTYNDCADWPCLPYRLARLAQQQARQIDAACEELGDYYAHLVRAIE